MDTQNSGDSNTGSFEDAASQAQEELSTTESTEEHTEGSEDQALDKQSDDQGQQQNTEESFFDPKQVPNELLPAYKQMQGAFTKKTQEIAEMRKQAEEWKQKADAYSKYEQYAPILEEMLSSKSNNQEDSVEMQALEKQLRDQGYNDDAVTLAKTVSQFFSQRQYQKEAQVNQLRENERIQSEIQQSAKLDTRLNDQSLVYKTESGETVTFGQMVEKLVNADPNWRADVITSTKKAIATVDALLNSAKQQGKAELSEKAKTSARSFPRNTASPQSAQRQNSASSFDDAAKEALQELGY